MSVYVRYSSILCPAASSDQCVIRVVCYILPCGTMDTLHAATHMAGTIATPKACACVCCLLGVVDNPPPPPPPPFP